MTTTNPTLAESLGRDGSDGRFARLSAAVRRLRTRAAGADVERNLLIVGGVLMPLGVLLILLGWHGASKTVLPFEQTSYLISGGILGLALVFAGGFVYFAYWQTVRIRESRQQSAELLAALARVETMLGGAGVPAAASRGGTGTASYVATPSGSIFHRPDCPVVAGRDDVKRVNPARTSLDACRICTPLEPEGR